MRLENEELSRMEREITHLNAALEQANKVLWATELYNKWPATEQENLALKEQVIYLEKLLNKKKGAPTNE